MFRYTRSDPYLDISHAYLMLPYCLCPRILTYGTVRGTALVDLCDLIKPHTTIRSLLSASSLPLHQPAIKFKVYGRESFFLYNAMTLECPLHNSEKCPKPGLFLNCLLLTFISHCLPPHLFSNIYCLTVVISAILLKRFGCVNEVFSSYCLKTNDKCPRFMSRMA